MIEERNLTTAELQQILKADEDHLTNLKSKGIQPAKLQETFVAFASADGGDIFVGVEDKRVHDNHQRLSRFIVSMSPVLNLPAGSVTRTARARTSHFVRSIRLGNSATSRHTIASLFMLRRCVSAESLSRSYTASGMFFKIKVVGIVYSNQSGTMMVSSGRLVKSPARTSAPMRANFSIERTRAPRARAADLKR